MATSMIATLGTPIVSSRTVASLARHSALPRMPAFFSLQRKPLQHVNIIGKASTSLGGGGTGGWQGGGGGGKGDGDDEFDSEPEEQGDKLGILGAFRRGWKRRVSADPQFAFKVFSEVVIGVAACVLGDMASRPNFGLNELDFVFSTVVVGSILNFTLMHVTIPALDCY